MQALPPRLPARARPRGRVDEGVARGARLPVHDVLVHVERGGEEKVSLLPLRPLRAAEQRVPLHVARGLGIQRSALESLLLRRGTLLLCCHYAESGGLWQAHTSDGTVVRDTSVQIFLKN